MLFDFDKFADITASVFPGGPYTPDEALGVFQYYFEQYEVHTGRPHPPICASQIVRIVRDMPWIEQADRGSTYANIPPESYPPMIDQHFQTRYRRCDYNINHFFSGRIRELRFYETCY